MSDIAIYELMDTQDQAGLEAQRHTQTWSLFNWASLLHVDMESCATHKILQSAFQFQLTGERPTKTAVPNAWHLSLSSKQSVFAGVTKDLHMSQLSWIIQVVLLPTTS